MEVVIFTIVYVFNKGEYRYTSYPVAPNTAFQLTTVLVLLALATTKEPGVAGITLMVQVALTPLPSFALQVITAVPIDLVRIKPVDSTVEATAELELDQVTALFDAFEGLTVAVSNSVLPIARFAELFESFIEETKTALEAFGAAAAALEA